MHKRVNRRLLYKAIKRAKQAEKAIQIKTNFVANVSYELRTPLTAIIGMAQLLTIDCLLPSQQERVTDILIAGEHMLTLVDKLSDAICLEAGEISVKVESFDLYNVFDELIQMLNFHIQAKGLQLLFNYATHVPRVVMGDVGLVRQLMLNLLSNTLRLTEQGSVIIHVTCEKYTEQHIELLLSIKDSGKGMTASELAQVKSYLNQNTLGQNHQYSGIDLVGLVIVATYLRLLSAQCDIESKVGVGTVITCKIPFDLPKNVAVSLSSSSFYYIASVEHGHLGKLRVLLVEDNRPAQKIYATMLEQLGCKVDVVTEAALGLFREHQYDIIFMDIGLPGLDGITITQMIRRLESPEEQIPIIALTAHAQKHDKIRFLAAGINSVMIKPARREDFFNLIKRWVS